MEGLKVLFILCALYTSWANAVTYGHSDSKLTVLTVNRARINKPTHVTFNLNNAYDVTIDQVVVDYYDSSATCTLVSGGPNKKSMDFLLTPTNAIAIRSGFNLHIIVYGHWNAGATEQLIYDTAIQFKTV